MVIKRFVVGLLETNCYVFGDDETKQAVVIDPGGDSDVIKEYLREEGLKLLYVINTHGHGDHIISNADFKKEVLIHRLDVEYLTNPDLNMSRVFGLEFFADNISYKELEDGDRISVGRLNLEVIHTPGHTPGGISLYSTDILFSGDTLFFEGVGRTDIPKASWQDLLSSIKNRLFRLSDECIVYPGHGPRTTIGYEKRNNPFV